MSLEVLHVTDCPNLAPMLDRLRQATDLPVSTRIVDTDADAVRYGMAGSPTLLVDGVDPFGPGSCTVSCRLYRDEDGGIAPAPSVAQLRAAIGTPAGVLSAWRTRAVPLDPAEQDAHRAILRSFASTGRPPADLDPRVLAALHAADAIRLGPDGQIAVAYPFSATPTRHRVRIGDAVDVHAMCAIDALGIAPMLGQDTLVESVDLTIGQPITVTTTGGRTHWQPATAVAFVGADGSGPSADCCCDYLNFFADRRAAETWASAHPQVPGQILDRAEAEALAGRLFGRLLA